MQSCYSMQDMNRCPCNQMGTMPVMEGNMTCEIMYPEVYYKVQPFIMTSCDQMISWGNMINQKMLDEAGESIYTNVCMMHPDLAEYANQYSMKSSVETQQRDWDYSPGYGRFRRRGLFRDFIDILLLNELFRRGRRFF